MNIPISLIIEILARLPLNEVVRCRCVCKSWFKVLSETEFVNLHLSKSPTGMLVHKLYSSSDSLSVGLVDVEEETDHRCVRYIAGMDRKIPRRSQSVGMTMIGSINGLVCINDYGYQYDLINIWNPVIREFITVQTPEGVGIRLSPNETTYGFGISSGNYHLVRIFQEIESVGSQIRHSACHIYTIGTGYWKNIGQTPYLHKSREHGLFLNGNLHWLIYDSKDDHNQICSLDLEKELFEPFPSPPELCQRDLATLNLYKGCLSLCDNDYGHSTVIWVMENYGVKSSWRKEVVIDLVGGYSEVAHIIKVFKDGENLLLRRDYMLFVYNLKRKTMKYLAVKERKTGDSNEICSQSYHCIEATDYVSSLVSLKNLVEPLHMTT